MRKIRPLTLELLEDRTAPAAFGGPWPEADELTLSFAPDGTAAGDRVSSLFRTLDAQAPQSAWQLEILRAFQTWAVRANLNVGLVGDGGQPFGTLGLKQGDPRFGDLRVGAYPMGDSVLAVADPYDPFIANTWVGDVFLNSTARLGVGGPTGESDLFSVLLHEAGHALGLDHSTDPLSPMFERFTQVRTGLTAEDVGRLQALYGARPADAYEGTTGNDTFATATGLGPVHSLVSLKADVTSLQDTDVFRLAVPDRAGGLDVQLSASGLSLLVPRLSAYDAAGNRIAGTVAADPLHNDVSLHLDRLKAGDVVYLSVASGTEDVFGIGAYRLRVSPLAAPPAASGPAGGTYGLPPITSAESGSALPDGVRLLATTPGYVEHSYYEAGDRLTAAVPVHTYRVRSADIGPGLANVMTVVVYSPDGQDARYHVSVSDSQGNSVPSAVVVDQGGHLVVQVPAVRSNQDYLVQVGAGDSSSGGDVGYVVEVDFAQDGQHLETFVNDTLGPDQRDHARLLQVNRSQQFHFVLSASDWGAPQETGVRLTISDATGREVFRMDVADGATRSADVLLDPGTYAVRFARAHEQPGAQLPLLFELKGTGLSEPIGPQLRDTTRQPVESAAPGDSSLAFYWLPFAPTASAGQTSPPALAAVPGLGGFPVSLLLPGLVFPAARGDADAVRSVSANEPGTEQPGPTPPSRLLSNSPTSGTEEEATEAGADRISSKQRRVPDAPARTVQDDSEATAPDPEVSPLAAATGACTPDDPAPAPGSDQTGDPPTAGPGQANRAGVASDALVQSSPRPEPVADGFAVPPATVSLRAALGIGVAVLGGGLLLARQPSHTASALRRLLSVFAQRPKGHSAVERDGLSN